MRKILGLLILVLFSTSLIYSQEGLNLDNIKDNPNYLNDEGNYDMIKIINEQKDAGGSETDLLPLLQDEEIINNASFEGLEELGEGNEGVDFTELKTSDNEEVVKVREAIVEDLEEQGLSPEEIDSTLTIAAEFAGGKTLDEIKKDNPDAYDNFETAAASIISNQVKAAILTEDSQQQIKDSLDMLGKGTNVLKGFAQATANTAIASNLFAHQGYKLFAVSMGFNLSIAADDPLQNAMFIINNSNDSDKILDELESKKVKAGLSLQSFSANVGINMSWLLDGLYLGVVLGSTAAEVSTEKAGEVSLLTIPLYSIEKLEANDDSPTFTATADSAIFGVRGNYQLIDPFSIPILFRWNGVNVGTGLIYTAFNISADLDISPALKIEEDTLGASVAINSSAFTIPLEISTGVRLLSAVNIGIGLGADLQFGSSTFDVDMDFGDEDNLMSKAINKTINDILAESESDLEFPLSIEGAPAVFNPRASLGVGIGLGPVTLDFIGTLYFQTGVTIGANFTLRL